MRKAAVVVIGALLFASSAWGNLAPAGNEFQVNTYTTGFQGGSGVAGVAGGFVVIWSDGGGGEILARRFDSLGTRLGTEFQVNDPVLGAGAFPGATSDAAGGFLALWLSTNRDGSALGIFGRRFDSLGAAQGSEFQVNTYTINQQYQAAIGPDGGSGFVVAWASRVQDAMTEGVFAQRLDGSGTKVGAEFQVNSYTPGAQQLPAVASDGGAGFVVVWDSGQDGSGSGIFAQRFDSGGARSGTEFQVNTYTPGGQFRADVAPGADGFVVVWMSQSQDGDGYGIFGQRFSSVGTRSGTEFQINTVTADQQVFYLGTGDTFPSWVVADGMGGFLVSWHGGSFSGNQDGDESGVFAQLFDSTGMRSGSQFQINTYTTDDQGYPETASNGAGGFTVVWNSYGQDGDTGGIFAQRFVVPRPDGEACAESAQCVSGNCADGVCCNDPCTGAMEACNVAGMVGTCSPTLPPGGACADGTQCESTFCTDDVCCNDPCTGAMEACDVAGMPGTCSPTLPLGDPCIDGTQCESAVCADGLCCDRECPGPGLTCDQPGQVGTCAVVASPAPAVSGWGIFAAVTSLLFIALIAIRRHVF